MTDNVVIRYDEAHDSFDVVVDGVPVYTANHDLHGWDGMVAVREVVQALASEVGFSVIEEGEPNV